MSGFAATICVGFPLLLSPKMSFPSAWYGCIKSLCRADEWVAASVSCWRGQNPKVWLTDLSSCFFSNVRPDLSGSHMPKPEILAT